MKKTCIGFVTLGFLFGLTLMGCSAALDQKTPSTAVSAADTSTAVFVIQLSGKSASPEHAPSLGREKDEGSSSIRNGVITLTKGSMKIVTNFSVTGTEVTIAIASVQVGNWNANVAFYDANGYLIYQGSSSFALNQGTTPTVNVAVSEITGNVSFGVTIPGSQLAYSASFSNATDTNNWYYDRRACNLSNNALCVDGNYLYSGSLSYASVPNGGRDGYAIYGMGNTSYTNYTFAVDFEGLTNYMGGYLNPIILFRVQNWQSNFTLSPINAYRIDLVPPDSVSSQNSWSFTKYDTNSIVTVTNGTSTLLVRGWNHIEISVNGGTIIATLNGATLFSYTDPSPIPYGGIGVGSVWETGSAFENVQIWE